MDKKVALQIRNFEPISRAAKAMKSAGFKYVAFAFTDKNLLLCSDWERKVYEIAEIFDKYSLKCIQTHAPFYPLLVSAEERDEGLEKSILRSVEATKILGADLLAVHPRSVIKEDETAEVLTEKSLKENIISFNGVVNLCEKLGITLGIENLMEDEQRPPCFYSCKAEDHAELIDKMNSKFVKAIWDFGHANIVNADHAERIKILGNRIVGTHVHQNDGKEDNHYPPAIPPSNAYFVKRTVDWNNVLKTLKSTGYDGYLTLETMPSWQHCAESYIRYLYDSVCELDDILRK